jgi:hypothetical protein
LAASIKKSHTKTTQSDKRNHKFCEWKFFVSTALKREFTWPDLSWTILRKIVVGSFRKWNSLECSTTRKTKKKKWYTYRVLERKLHFPVIQAIPFFSVRWWIARWWWKESIRVRWPSWIFNFLIFRESWSMRMRFRCVRQNQSIDCF